MVIKSLVIFTIGLVFNCFPNRVLANENFLITTGGTGLELDIIKAVNYEIFDRLGQKVIIKEDVPSKRSLMQVNHGQSDADGLRIVGLEKIYQNLVRVSEPYMNVQFVGFSKNKNIQLDGWESLKHHKIGYINGWMMVEKNIQNINFSKDYMAVTKANQLFLMLDLDRIDIAIYQKMDGFISLKELGLTDIHLLEKPLVTIPLYLYVNKKHIQLVPQIANALKAIKKDGTYDQLIKDIHKSRNTP